MPIRIIRWGLVLGLGPALAAALMLPCFAQQIHHNGFETNRTSWLKGSGDVPFKETAHDISDEVAHEGKRSEHIQTDSLQGKEILYYYPTGNAPISDDLTISVWVKSNHPGIQLMARVVLPKEADPASLQDRLTTIIRGDAYKKVGQWQRLEILRPVKLAQEQQRLMQAESQRTITFQDAFIDRLVLNVYGGTGVTDVWIDELEIGPVYEMPGAKATAPAAPNGGSGRHCASGSGQRLVEFNDRNLQVDGKNFFCRGIQYTDTPLDILRDAGFNTLFVSHPWDAAKLKQMTNMGFMLVPNLSVTSDDARLVSADTLTRDVRGFPEPANVLFFNLGTALSYEQASLVGRIAPAIRAVDRQRRKASTPGRPEPLFDDAGRRPGQRPSLAADDNPGIAPIQGLAAGQISADQAGHLYVDMDPDPHSRLFHAGALSEAVVRGVRRSDRATTRAGAFADLPGHRQRLPGHRLLVRPLPGRRP